MAIHRTDHDGTRELLLSSAIDLFYEKGYVGASVRDIVKAVNVTNSILYHHFKDKNELLYVIIDRIGLELIKSLKQVEQEYDDPMERLSRMIYTQICIVKERKREVKIFLEEQYQLEPKYKAGILRQHREIYSLYMDQLNALEDRGMLRNVNKTVLNFAIHAMMNWSYRWYREDGPLSIEQVADSITDIFFHGILKK